MFNNEPVISISVAFPMPANSGPTTCFLRLVSSELLATATLRELENAEASRWERFCSDPEAGRQRLRRSIQKTLFSHNYADRL